MGTVGKHTPVQQSIGVTFGALASPFREQEIGKYLSAKACDQYQREADAITLLRVTGLIGDKCAKSARDKMYKRMSKSVRAAITKARGDLP